MSALTPEVIASWSVTTHGLCYSETDLNERPLPQYDNPSVTLTPAIWGVEITMIILMTAFMAGRFYSRTVLVKGALGWDDWIMFAAYVCYFPVSFDFNNVLTEKSRYWQSFSVGYTSTKSRSESAATSTMCDLPGWTKSAKSLWSRKFFSRQRRL